MPDDFGAWDADVQRRLDAHPEYGKYRRARKMVGALSLTDDAAGRLSLAEARPRDVPADTRSDDA